MIESVAVRQRGGYDFETHYDNLCALQNSCPMSAVKAHLSEGVLDINGDRVKYGILNLNIYFNAGCVKSVKHVDYIHVHFAL